MRRANAQLQSDRRDEILDAAERCFARSGFHQASMQEICTEAGMSPGNLYRYFRSKEDTDRRHLRAQPRRCRGHFARVGQAADFFDALARSPAITWSSAAMRRSRSAPRSWPRAGAIPRSRASIKTSRSDIKSRIAAMLRDAIERGEVRADLDVDSAAVALMVLADGMSWRRAVEPGFDASA